MKSYVQIFKILIIIFSGLIIISILSGISPWGLIGSIGAISAVLLLIFRDTILSLIANLQMSSNKLVQLHEIKLGGKLKLRKRIKALQKIQEMEIEI